MGVSYGSTVDTTFCSYGSAYSTYEGTIKAVTDSIDAVQALLNTINAARFWDFPYKFPKFERIEKVPTPVFYRKDDDGTYIDINWTTPTCNSAWTAAWRSCAVASVMTTSAQAPATG